MTLTRFVLAVHCHQPVGNFGWIFEEAFESAYQPFLKILSRHPEVKVALHYSGPLLDWFLKEQPSFLKTLRGLVQRGQVEVMGGGYCEPILSMIPASDAVGQLNRMRQVLQRLGLTDKQGPAGAWLAERVWEANLPSIFQAAGIRYTVVDDHHLALAGIPAEKQFGFYLTEDQGKSVALFPSSKLLRYQVPFKPVAQVMETLHGLRSEEPRVAVLADDGEKFGLWPGTKAWVYQEGWLESFLSELTKNRQWLKMMTFEEALKSLPPLGQVALPAGSYEEMDQWSAGYFRNFFIKYPESQQMARKMLWISGRLAELAAPKNSPKGRLLLEARNHLYQAQDNDPYWHGVFGGLYLRHLRRAVWRHLLEAEEILDGTQGRRRWVEGKVRHLEADGKGEILLRSAQISCSINPREGGKLVELSDKKLRVNLLDTLTRRPEPYHERIRSKAGASSLVAAGSASGAAGEAAPMSIHDPQDKDPAYLADLLVYDPYRRAALIDHIFPPEAQVAAAAGGENQDLADFYRAEYQPTLQRGPHRIQVSLTREGQAALEGGSARLRIRKEVTLRDKQRGISVAYRLTNRSDRTLSFLFGSEIGLGLKDAHVNRVGEAEKIRRFELLDPALRARVSWALSKEARLWYFPLETVSASEQGMERTYQGAVLIFLWSISIRPSRNWSVGLEWQIDEQDGGP